MLFRSLRHLFDTDPERGTRMTVSAADLYLDYSKHRVTEETVDALMARSHGFGLRSFG